MSEDTDTIENDSDEIIAARKAEESDVRRTLFDLLARRTITRVVIDFDGSGDSGQVEGVTAYGVIGADGNQVIDLTTITVPGDMPGEWDAETRTFTTRGKTLNDLVSDFAYEALESTGIDWYNNDGGWGEIHLHVHNRTCHVEMNQRIVSSEYSEHEF